MPASVEIPGPLRRAYLVDRPNRFLIRARMEPEHEVVEAHLPDPGKLREFTAPGTSLWLGPAEGNRRTRWTARLAAAAQGTLVSLDTNLPNALVHEALRMGMPELDGFELQRAEVPRGRHRFDFLLSDAFGNDVLLEVKGVNWAEEGVGLFPDAQTERGTNQVRALTEHVREGGAAALLFVCQRSDIRSVRLAHDVDPRFVDAMRAAVDAGVRVFARRCLVTLEEMALGSSVPFTLDAGGATSR